MQKVTIVTKKPDWVNKTMVEETSTHIVASTKSLNNLVEEFQSRGETVASKRVVEIFLDREVTEKAVDRLVEEQINDSEIVDLVKKFVKDALDKSCVYYKPIIRKK